MRQRQLIHKSLNLISLGNVFFQELLSCGNVVKKVAYYNRSSVGAAGTLVFKNFAAVYFKAAAQRFGGFFCEKLHLGDGCNRSKRFAAKSEREYLVEVVGGFDLACRVTKKRGRNFLVCNSAAVVRNAHEASAAVLYFNGDVLCSCVYRVFNKLLYDRRGTFDNFARCNKFKNAFIK